MVELAPKRPADSRVEMTEIILPQYTNALGTAFGGQILAWMDIAAAVAAARHGGRTSVTACIDRVRFGEPIRMGDTVTLKAQVQWVGRTSMEVGVKVFTERTGVAQHLCVTATLVFVCLDEERRPIPVPQLVLESDDELKRFAEGAQRAAVRRAERKQAAS